MVFALTLPGIGMIPLPRLGTGTAGMPSASFPAAERLLGAVTFNSISTGWFVRIGRDSE